MRRADLLSSEDGFASVDYAQTSASSGTQIGKTGDRKLPIRQNELCSST